MNCSLRTLLIVLFAGFANLAFAQNSGIAGRITDGTSEGLINASVQVTSGGISRGGTITDFDGNYEVRSLPAGNYEVLFSYQGRRKSVTDISVGPNQIVTLNAALENKTELKGATVVGTRYTKPLVDIRSPGGIHTMTSEEIEKLPTLNTNDAASLGTSAYQQKNGAGIQLAGGRASATKYIVDGVQLPPGDASGTNLSPGSIDQIQTLTSGLPARYGDATGGVISITTKGVTATTRGSVWLEHSVDGYNNNLLSLNLSGPLLRVKDSAGNKRPVLGYQMSASGTYNQDGDPTYYKNYYLKDDVLARLEANPLVIEPQPDGAAALGNAAEYVRAGDFVQEKRQRHAESYNGRFSGKLDYALNNNVNITLGGSYDNSKNAGANYNNSTDYPFRRRSIFDPNGYSEQLVNTTRGYLRFSQRFGKGTGAAENGTISNASYTIQADYSRTGAVVQDPNHKDNPFLYGYVGKFTQRFTPGYEIGVDSNTNIFAIRQTQNVLDGVDFQRAEYNPVLANYVDNYFQLSSNQPTRLSDIIGGRGSLLNGGGASDPYGLFNTIGAGQRGFSKSLNEQVAISADAAFDIKGKRVSHSIEFGIYYQQRTERFYNINGASLWSIMRQSSGRVNANNPDQNKPIFVVNGQRYTQDELIAQGITVSPYDTILYDTQIGIENQGAFDKNIRQQLGLNTDGRDFIQIDALDPTALSLNLFSPDDLFNGGESAVTYYGYDHTGKLQTGQVNFNDFFTKKDAQGYYTRPIGAFRPNYIAGYVSDFIQFKDFKISLGVRAERFDLNTKVLRDPYSLYAIRHADGTNAQWNNANGGKHPDGITDEYAVYVDDNNTQTPTIKGYRLGDTWYDAKGTEVSDPSLLTSTASGSAGNLQPYLQNNKTKISDSSFIADESFTDYKPQVNLMPRINFSFPINDNAFFYAHYDVVVQRPTTGYNVTPADYFFFQKKANNIDNGNLKPERLIDYEVGFNQKLTSNSAVILTAFYKERKDQIARRPYYFAWPQTYFSYGNRDFSTTKGFTATYDLRRTNHLAMEIAYTLQFVEGTGSNESTRAGLLQNFTSAGTLNLRPVFPLNIDSRHILNIQADYRYNDGEGPTIGSSHFLENAGVKLVSRIRSGEPYTQFANAQNLLGSSSNVIEGVVGGSRLPWHYVLDLRIDKDFSLHFGKKDSTLAGVRDRRRSGGLFFNAYIRVENLLNTRDVLSVNSYTGDPLDDGFLTSPQGETTIKTQVNQSSFMEQYRIALQNPDRFNGPRRMTIGLQINF